MKRIALITLASIAFFATAATAHQNVWGNNHMRGNDSVQQNGFSYGNCPMGGNMMGNRMMNGVQHPTDQSVNNNWRANPSYQGQAVVSGDTGK